METRPLKLQTTKIDAESLRLLRIISAKTGEHQYEVMRRLLREEHIRLRQERSAPDED